MRTCRPFCDEAWFNKVVQHQIHKRRGARGSGPSDAQKREGYKQLRIATQVCLPCIACTSALAAMQT